MNDDLHHIHPDDGHYEDDDYDDERDADSVFDDVREEERREFGAVCRRMGMLLRLHGLPSDWDDQKAWVRLFEPRVDSLLDPDAVTAAAPWIEAGFRDPTRDSVEYVLMTYGHQWDAIDPGYLFELWQRWAASSLAEEFDLLDLLARQDADGIEALDAALDNMAEPKPEVQP